MTDRSITTAGARLGPRIADRVALVRLAILGSYLTTNACIVAGVIRHWNN